jgi:hypothetical protein
MDHQHSEMIADAACHEIQRAGYEWTNAAVHLYAALLTRTQ